MCGRALDGFEDQMVMLLRLGDPSYTVKGPLDRWIESQIPVGCWKVFEQNHICDVDKSTSSPCKLCPLINFPTPEIGRNSIARLVIRGLKQVWATTMQTSRTAEHIHIPASEITPRSSVYQMYQMDQSQSQ